MSSVKDRVAMFESMKAKQLSKKVQNTKKIDQQVVKKSQIKSFQSVSNKNVAKEQQIAKSNTALNQNNKIEEQTVIRIKGQTNIIENHYKTQRLQGIEVPVIKPSEIKNQLQKMFQIGMKPKIVQESIKVPQQEHFYVKQEKRNPLDIKPIQGRQAKPSFQQNKQMLNNLFKQRQRKGSNSPNQVQPQPIYSHQTVNQQVVHKPTFVIEDHRKNNPAIKTTFNQQNKKHNEKEAPRVSNTNLSQQFVNHIIPQQRTDFLINRLFPQSNLQNIQAKRTQILMMPKSQIQNYSENDMSLEVRGKGKKKKQTVQNFDDM